MRSFCYRRAFADAIALRSSISNALEPALEKITYGNVPQITGEQIDIRCVDWLPVMNAQCPDCGSGLGELLEKTVVDGEVIADFCCPECGHEWSVPL